MCGCGALFMCLEHFNEKQFETKQAIIEGARAEIEAYLERLTIEMRSCPKTYEECSGIGELTSIFDEVGLYICQTCSHPWMDDAYMEGED